MITPKNIHDQYAKGISGIIEKQIKEEMPDLKGELFIIELQARYNKLFVDYFHFPDPAKMTPSKKLKTAKFIPSEN